MANNWSEIWNKLRHSDKKMRVILALGLIGVLLIAMSEVVPNASKKPKTQQEISYTEYVSALEKETASLISDISGVGRCRVMLTLKETRESVYAKNAKENSGDSSFSTDSEYVLYNGQNGEEPLLVKQYFPEVQGVAIVCDGADNTVVREAVIQTVASLFNLSVSKISVSKYKG